MVTLVDVAEEDIHRNLAWKLFQGINATELAQLSLTELCHLLGCFSPRKLNVVDVSVVVHHFHQLHRRLGTFC